MTEIVVDIEQHESEVRRLNEIAFMPLGGGQSVGASCYYLRLGNSNIILDAGIGNDMGIEFEPDFHSLLVSPYIQSMNQIDQIFISHAHSDHIGYLMKLMKQAEHASVYMTETTKNLVEFQLYDRLLIGKRVVDENVRLATKSLIEKIATVSFMQTIDFGKYKVTFFPAGHIPGAMMMLFEFGKRKILYTGDYSLESTALTEGCKLPVDMDIDTIIMCGLHAKHPDYKKNSNNLFKCANYVLKTVMKTGKSLRCQTSQLSKSIEFLKVLNDWNDSKIPIYIDASVMNLICKLERVSISVLTENNKQIGEVVPAEPHIYLTLNRGIKGTGLYEDIKVDFSLHEDFEEMRRFLKNLNPKQAIVVHCGKEKSVFDNTIEQEMMLDGECRTQFTFAEDQEIYRL